MNKKLTLNQSRASKWLAGALVGISLLLPTQQGEAAQNNLNIGIVNFRKCAENSKIGKREQGSFEEMKNRMESFLQEKEQALNEIGQKLNDPDYLDGISKESETELKHKYRAMGQELGQAQQQFMQMLQQANVRVVQMIAEEVSVVANEIAENKKFDFVLNEEALIYHKPAFDITDQVVAKMDQKFDKENKEAKK